MPASLLREPDATAPTENPPPWTTGQIATALVVPALLLGFLLLALALPCMFDLPID